MRLNVAAFRLAVPVFVAAITMFCAVIPAKATVAYRADVVLWEQGQEPRICGTVQAAHDGRARLDVDLGAPGRFFALVLPKDKSLLIASEAVKGYVTIPLHGDEKDLRGLVMRAAEAVMPMAAGVLTLTEEDRKDLGRHTWQGWPAEVSSGRFVARFMGMLSVLTVELWENDDFAPFPLRIVNLGGGEGENGDVVELRNIIQSPQFTPNNNIFTLPADVTRYSSVLNLLLYALSIS